MRREEKRVNGKICIVACLVLAVVALIFYFQLPANKQGVTSISPPTKESSEKIAEPSSDPALLEGLWKGNDVYPYPRFLEISDGKMCSSWSGFTLKDYKCFEYTPYITSGNRILLYNNPVFGWDFTDGKLVLTPMGSTTKEIYERVATSTLGEKPLFPEESYPQVQKTPASAILPLPPSLKLLPWKSYENAVFGYRLNHPADYFVKRGRGLDPDATGAYVLMLEDLEPLKQSLGEPQYDLYYPPFNDFMFIIASKGLKASEWINAFQEISCSFDPHYSMKLNFVGEVKIGKGNYPAKKYRGNICTFGKTIKKDVDIVETYFLEYDGYTYYIEVAWVNRELAWRKKVPLEERLNSILESFELISRTPLPPKPLRFLYPTGGEVWRMKERIYTLRWTTDDFEWHNGYGTSNAKGGTAVFSQVPSGDGIETHITETSFDAGEFTWIIPLSSRVYLDSDTRILMRVFPKGVSTTTHNPYFVYSEPLIIKPLASEYPTLEFLYPVGEETIKLGTPTTFRWNVLPPEIEKFGLYITKRFNPSDTALQGVSSGSILPQKIIKNAYGYDEYTATGWTKGMTSYAWDGKTVYNGPYIETLSPGRYVLQLNFVMPDKFFTYIESKEFTITP